MGAPSAPSPGVIEWGVASRPLPGERESGDLHVVAPFEGGVLVAAIDGLGHGAEAAQAARTAADVLHAEPDQPLGELMRRCHAALRRSRGAVMTLAAIDARTDRLTWTAVGNVQATLRRAPQNDAGERAIPKHETVVPRGGVVGYQMPPLREVTVPVGRGDALIFATDGIGPDLIADGPTHGSAQDHADDLLHRYARSDDDALVLVIRYLGRRP